MSKLIMLKGLPASGKSSFAISLANARANTVRVNKDEIRLELNQPWSRELEKKVLELRDQRITEALKSGLDVISDDTNLVYKHERRLRELAIQSNARFELNETFLAVPIETCIERDSKREGSARVGEKVIRDMAAKYITTVGATYTPIPGLPEAIICDLDGTLALHVARGPYEAEKCDTDSLNLPVKWVLDSAKLRGVQVIYLSGREDKVRGLTLSWLDNNECPVGPLYMRTTDDFRNDTIVKAELFDAHIRGKFNVLMALDDRDRIIKLWRDMGITALQCNYGDF